MLRVNVTRQGHQSFKSACIMLISRHTLLDYYTVVLEFVIQRGIARVVETNVEMQTFKIIKRISEIIHFYPTK